MANPFHTYFGQTLTQVHLNTIFDELFASVDRFIEDFAYSGIVAGGTVTQHTPPNLTVDVEAPTVVYDQFAHRMQFLTPVSVNLAIDENGASTAVAGNVNEKWLSIFIKFTSTPTAPEPDDLGNTVYTRDVFGYRLNVVQGSESAAGTAVPPALRGDQILLADVKRTFSTTSFLNASISLTRAQTVINLNGSPLSIKAKGLKGALQAMLSSINSIANLVSALDVDQMPTDGAAGSPYSIASGPLGNALAAILGYINSLRTDVDAIDVPDVSNVARRNTGNTFTHQALWNVPDAETALIGTSLQPDEDPARPTNKWRLIFLFKVSSGQYVYFYSGRNSGDGEGAFAVVTNAVWLANEQRWTQRDGSKSSHALVWHQAKIRVCGKEPLAGTFPGSTARWEDWGAAGTLEAGAFYYSPARSETIPVPIINYGFGAQMDPAGYIVANTTNAIQVGVLMPRRSRWGTMRISHYQPDSIASQFRLLRTNISYSPAGAMSLSPIGPLVSGPSSAGHHTVTISLPSEDVDPTQEYRLVWIPGAVGARLQGAVIVNALVYGPD